MVVLSDRLLWWYIDVVQTALWQHWILDAVKLIEAKFANECITNHITILFLPTLDFPQYLATQSLFKYAPIIHHSMHLPCLECIFPDLIVTIHTIGQAESFRPKLCVNHPNQPWYDWGNVLVKMTGQFLEGAALQHILHSLSI